MSRGACRAASSIGSLFALASILLIPQASSTIASVTIGHPRDQLQRRTYGEHVVLADCKSTDAVASSEVAYYSGAPDSSPDDIAQVDTEDGKTQQWASNSSSAYFNETGVTFRATLGPAGTDGDYAGTANNGYGDFTCWQRASANLYSHGGKTCSGVYDCDHDAVPTSSTTNRDLSTGAIAGITVGVAIATFSLLGIAGFFLWRRYRPNKPRDLPEEDQAKAKMKSPEPDVQIMSRPIHELDAQTRPVEVHGDARIELGEAMRFSWLPSPGLPEYDPGPSPGTSALAGAYGDQKGTI